MTATPTPLRERHAQIAAMPLEQTCGGRMSHDEVASKVRMLMRSDLDHEAVCTIARDRIAWLAGRVAELEAALSARDAAGAVGEPFLWIDPRQFDRVRRFANDPHVVGRRYAPAWLKKYDDDYIPLFLAALATPPASGEAGAGVQICTFADCTCDALHTTTSGEPIDHAATTPLRELLAKAIADHIGHGMAEKCEGHADAVLAALSARDAAGAVGVVYRRKDRKHEKISTLHPSAEAVAIFQRVNPAWEFDSYLYATQPASGEAVNYFDVQRVADELGIDYNKLCTAIRRLAAVAPAGMVLVPRELVLSAGTLLQQSVSEIDRREGAALLTHAAPTPPATAGEE